MYDLKHERIFNASDLQSTRMAEWWKDATPFWSTAAKHGKKIAFYNWHDCQLPGAALEDPKDCRPYEAAPNNAHPSKSKIAREFDEGICEIYLHFFFYFYILASSSIWPCQIQNSEYRIFVLIFSRVFV